MTSQRVCVYCRERPMEDRWRPFCSERCKLLDLAAWADGAYRIPAEPVPGPDDVAEPDDHHER
jgi:endogenous inhibitor of DNA gyrase (YacG/DUF329 family)